MAKKTVTKKKTTPSITSRNVLSAKTSGRRINRQFLIVILSIPVFLGALYLLRSHSLVAQVNSEAISRAEFVKELEKQSGKQVLNNLVTKTLIAQEAKRQNISVSQSEIDQEIKKAEENLAKQGQKLEEVLQLQGMSKTELIEQIKLQKTVEKLVGKDIQVNDQEVTDYIEKNKELFQDQEVTAEQKESIKQQLKQQKLSEAFQTWLQKLQENAKIQYFVQY